MKLIVTFLKITGIVPGTAKELRKEGRRLILVGVAVGFLAGLFVLMKLLDAADPDMAGDVSGSFKARD